MSSIIGATTPSLSRPFFPFAAALLTVVAAIPAAGPVRAAEAPPAETRNEDKDEPKKTDLVEHVVVTATRTEEKVFDVPQPVSVVSAEEIREAQPNTATDLLRELPGVDVNGVGTSQPRPFIRGQRGQRILLLEDSLRLNNSRRQSDFGELPGLVDVDTAERIEIVRGPASVLYGSDAIGGVVNIITMDPPREPLGGRVSYRYGSVDQQKNFDARIGGRMGRYGYQITGGYRTTQDYRAPAGTYGDIRLDRDVFVSDTGVRDHSVSFRGSYALKDGQDLFAKVARYRAGETGFGFVDPDAFDPGSARVRLIYPYQDFDQFTFGYRGKSLERSWVDSIEATAYLRNNERRFDQDIFVPFGIPGLPDAGVQINATNFTDYETLGMRTEARKLLGGKHVLTYGFDGFHDKSENNDFLETAIVGFGPPMIETDTSPRVPNATYESFGLFVQDEAQWHPRFKAILGVRYQDTTAKTKDTPGLIGAGGFESSDDSAVWAANLIFAASDNVKIIGSIGRAFRSPNLIERFFDGPTPEGSGYESRNLALEPETSLNYDIGVKYRRSNVYFEATYFRNTLKDGIRLRPTGGEVGGLPEFQNVNVDELRYQGGEVSFDWNFADGFFLGANYSRLRGKDVKNPVFVAADTYSSKVNFGLGYRDPDGRFWAEYRMRRNGEQKDIQLVDNPIGDVLPAYDVHLVRGGLRLRASGNVVQRLTAEISNLSNELYAEFSNATFFRPEPGRSLSLSYGIDF